MTRLKPRIRDKVIAALGAIDRKVVNRDDPSDTKIQELEEKMEKETFDIKKELGMNYQSFVKRSNKSHKGLR